MSKVIKKLIICGLFGFVCFKAYDKAYDMTTASIEERDAEDDYQKLLKQLEGVSFDKDISETVYNVTGVNVGINQYYSGINGILERVEKPEEFELLVDDYIKTYAMFNCDELKYKSSITFEDGDILYDDKKVEMDIDAEIVIGNILNNLDILKDVSGSDKVELMKELKKQIIISQLYEKEESQNKQLSLILKENVF